MSNALVDDTNTLIRQLRWQSRRGWLELDLLLSCFWQTLGSDLSRADLLQLRQWLQLEDNQLWQIITQPLPHQSALAAKLSASSYNRTTSKKGKEQYE